MAHEGLPGGLSGGNMEDSWKTSEGVPGEDLLSADLARRGLALPIVTLNCLHPPACAGATWVGGAGR